MKQTIATLYAAAFLCGCGAANMTEPRVASATPSPYAMAPNEPKRCEIYNPWTPRSCYEGTGFTAPHAEQNGEPR